MTTPTAPVAPQNYLSPADQKRIREELKELRARRAAAAFPEDGVGYCRPAEVEVSDAQLRNRQNHLERTLATQTPPTLDAVKKNAVYREFQGLVKEFERNALTQYDQGLGYPTIMKKTGADHERDFERAKVKCAAWEMAPRGQYVGHRLKQLAGLLDPSNAELRNLENFRRRK